MSEGTKEYTNKKEKMGKRVRLRAKKKKSFEQQKHNK